MISVCITTYNGEKYIKDQLDSIISQIGDDDEIIVSDDGSTDRTLSIISEYNDPRIKIFHHIKNNKFSNFSFDKISRNFENALNNAKGDLIFFSDQDDVWLENKVTRTQQLLGDEFWMLVHDCFLINEDGEIIQESYFKLNNSKPGFIKNIINSSYLGCCMAFDRSLLKIALPLPDRPVPHDIWLGLLAEWSNKVCFSEERLINYRRHTENQSTSGESSKFSFNYKLKYRYILCVEIIKRIFSNLF